MTTSKIEWTGSTWNPITGCTKYSDGCQNCYAEKMAIRLKNMGLKKYSNAFKLTLHNNTIDIPLNIKKAQTIFVCSMSDIFHNDVPDNFILELFKVMNKAHWHTFQVLTKRAERISLLNGKINWTENIWLGTTVENNKATQRIKHLKDSGAFVKFLSLEPLLERINHLNLDGIDWVIVGGESGYKARPIQEDWVRDIRETCNKQKVPFFFKQWGGKNKKKAGRLLDGKTYNEMPLKDMVDNFV
ncbi:MAG: phage Gp37/Gp68 family protein [Campylobacteraceae bacterium]|jgi:protein gp37|nr:phage Gp37/Gp68 family protein [Campylobacteraceae bacterium]